MLADGVAPPEMVEKVRKWEDLSTKHGVSLPAVAMAFAALPACVARVVIGCSKAEEVESNLAFCEGKHTNNPEYTPVHK